MSRRLHVTAMIVPCGTLRRSKRVKIAGRRAPKALSRSRCRYASIYFCQGEGEHARRLR